MANANFHARMRHRKIGNKNAKMVQKRPKHRTGDKCMFDTETGDRQLNGGQTEKRANVFLAREKESKGGEGTEREGEVRGGGSPSFSFPFPLSAYEEERGSEKRW